MAKQTRKLYITNQPLHLSHFTLQIRKVSRIEPWVYIHKELLGCANIPLPSISLPLHRVTWKTPKGRRLKSALLNMQRDNAFGLTALPVLPFFTCTKSQGAARRTLVSFVTMVSHSILSCILCPSLQAAVSSTEVVCTATLSPSSSAQTFLSSSSAMGAETLGSLQLFVHRTEGRAQQLSC